MALIKTYITVLLVAVLFTRTVGDIVVPPANGTKVSSTFNTNVEASESSVASVTGQLFPKPNNYPNVFSGVIARHHPPAVKPPGSTAGSEEPGLTRPDNH